MTLRNHAAFGVYLMPLEDAVLWIVMGLIVGAWLAWYCFARRKP